MKVTGYINTPGQGPCQESLANTKWIPWLLCTSCFIFCLIPVWFGFSCWRGGGRKKGAQRWTGSEDLGGGGENMVKIYCLNKGSPLFGTIISILVQ